MVAQRLVEEYQTQVEQIPADMSIPKAAALESESSRGFTYLYCPTMDVGIYMKVKNSFLDFSLNEPGMHTQKQRRSVSVDPLIGLSKNDEIPMRPTNSQEFGKRSKAPEKRKDAKTPKSERLAKGASNGIMANEKFEQLCKMNALQGIQGLQASRSNSQPRRISKTSYNRAPSHESTSVGSGDERGLSMESIPSSPAASETVPSPTASMSVDAPDTSLTQGVSMKKGSKKTKVRPPISNPEEVTTLMIRGIPCRLTEDDILSSLDKTGLAGTYDFFYLPRPVNSNSNLGYAFVNFINTESAEKCTAALHGCPLEPARSKKMCMICPAHLQGFENLQASFRSASVPHRASGPRYFQATSDKEGKC